MERLGLASLVAAIVGLNACGGGAAAEPGQGLRKSARMPMEMSALSSENGMSTNGMSTNGLALSGLNVSFFSTSAFVTWFAINPSYSDMVLTYLAKCAMPASMSFSYSYAGVNYTWTGELGLAPQWLAGNAAPLIEQQLVSACMGAHVNKYGVHVSISVRGVQESGASIPVSWSESQQFDNDEGCFFGNLFDGTGVFSGYSANSPLTQTSKTSTRACAISGHVVGQCSPMIATGQTCQSLCTAGISASGAFEYKSCTWHGVTYAPITVRLQDSDIATCGDGVCAESESCYNPWTNTGCKSDCGVCSP